MIWDDFLPPGLPLAQSTGPASGTLLPSHLASLCSPSEEKKWGTPPGMDIGGQAPQTGRHGSRALTGLSSQTWQMGTSLEEGGPCHCLLSNVPFYTSPPAVRLKNKKGGGGGEGAGGYVGMICYF